MKKQVEKFEFVIKEIINGYFVTDQKLALLSPLLEDKKLFKTWDGTPGVRGVEALRLTLYMAVLSDMRALLFDGDKRSASLEQVIEALRNEHFVKMIRQRFCKPPGVNVCGHDDDEEMRKFVEEQVQADHVKHAEESFDTLGSTPFLRTLQRSPIMGVRSVYAKTKEIQPRVQAGGC